MKLSARLFGILACILVFGLAPTATAHGHDDNTTTGGIDHHKSLNQSIADATAAGTSSYFHLSDHSAVIFAHIVLMSAAWIFVLPLSELYSTHPLATINSHCN